ncbi:MAG: type II secretion system F family protein [Sedimentisphaerales bacterium]|nr:type II secretion system F family protein [Sedimentisphaerales bacterium]
MPSFQYKAINRSGQQLRGELNAPDMETAQGMLAERGLFTDEIRPLIATAKQDTSSKPKKTYKLKLTDRQRVELIGQLATALGAQLPLMSALQVVAQQNPSARVQSLLKSMAKTVESGQTLSFALKQYPRSFDDLHISMVQLGEASGKLDQSMSQLASLTERDYETKNRILTAALYPGFVLCIGIISVAIVVTWILPQVISTLATETALLPWPTRALLAISGFLRLYGGFITAGLLILYLALRQWKNSPMGSYYMDAIKLRIPIVGPLRRKWAVSRFARTLGTLTHSGINILDALQIVRNCLGNEVLARETDQLTQKIRSGSSLAEPLRRSGNFPPLLVQIVTVGEQTGRLGESLLKVADAFDKDTDVAVNRFMSLFPAILILILAAMVGFIVAATLLPIVQIETGITPF